jgi:hypothetical protein
MPSEVGLCSERLHGNLAGAGKIIPREALV